MRLIVNILVGCGALWLLARWFEWKNVYAPTSEIEATPESVGLEFEEIEFIAEDGVRLHGWWISHPEARGTILYCHGNGSNIGNRVNLCRDLHALGVNIFIFDYRGYGRSRGWSTEQGTYRDARAAYEVIRAKYDDMESPPVLVYGASLGACIAAQLALDKPVVGAVFEAGFSSVVDVGKHLFPNLPVSLISRFRYEADRRVAQIRAPKLFASSRDDQLIPLISGKSCMTPPQSRKPFLNCAGRMARPAGTKPPPFGRPSRPLLTRPFRARRKTQNSVQNIRVLCLDCH
ncbi:MAG: lysophospholipase [Kiritimatiellae bacterium]|nr:lysophospholipase [Kiritimatiellia bacterium]